MERIKLKNPLKELIQENKNLKGRLAKLEAEEKKRNPKFEVMS